MKLKIDYILLFLLVLLLAINIPFLVGSTPIDWDSFNIFEGFFVTYRGVLNENQVPLWFPYSVYGFPNYWDLSGLSIFSYLFIYIGKLIQSQDPLILFKISLVCEQLICLFGMYLLSNQLFRRKSTVLISCIALMTTFVVYRQIIFSFRMVYLLPLILYWIVIFFNSKSIKYLLLAGLTMLCLVPGSSFYSIVVTLYSAGIFAVALFIQKKPPVKPLLKFSKINIFLVGILLLVSLLFFYYFLTFNDGVIVSRRGREANLVVETASYLHNWEKWNPLDTFVAYVFGFVTDYISNGFEYILYIGLLPLLGIAISLWYQRTPTYLAFLAAAIFLLLFSLRGIFTLMAFYLPVINMTRYVTILGMIPLRLFLILLGGFGLDMELTGPQWKKVLLFIAGFMVVAEIVVALVSPAAATGYLEIFENPDKYNLDIKLIFARVLLAIVLILGVYLITELRKPKSKSPLKTDHLSSIAMVFFMLIDCGLLRFNFEQKVTSYFTPLERKNLILPTTSPLTYQEQRLQEPLDENTENIYDSVIPYQANNGTNIILESFVGFDQCLPNFVKVRNRFEMYTFSLNPLFDHDLDLIPNKEIPSGVKQLYGCEFPKLRVVSNVQVATDNAEALSLIKTTSDFSNLLILSKEYSDTQTSLENTPVIAEIVVKQFTHNKIAVDVDLSQGHGWLVYSDTYHNEWQASVNESPVKIERAYLAFKAVPLTQGKNSIIMWYGSPLKKFAFNAITILSAMFALALLAGFFYVFLFYPNQRMRRVRKKTKLGKK